MSFVRFRFHLIFATKHRTPWIDAEVEEFLYPVLGRAAKNTGAKAYSIGGVEDHVHMVSSVPARLAFSDFVRKIKSQSTAAVRKEFSHLEEFGWQVGYGGFTLNPLDMDAIFAYVKNQKERHRKDDLWEPYEKITEDETEEEEEDAAIERTLEM